MGAALQAFARPLRQEPVSAVLQHGQRQRALEHQGHRLLVAPWCEIQIARIETKSRPIGAEANWPRREEERVYVRVQRGVERKGGFVEGDAGVDQPASVADNEPQAGD